MDGGRPRLTLHTCTTPTLSPSCLAANTAPSTTASFAVSPRGAAGTVHEVRSTPLVASVIALSTALSVPCPAIALTSRLARPLRYLHLHPSPSTSAWPKSARVRFRALSTLAGTTTRAISGQAAWPRSPPSTAACPSPAPPQAPFPSTSCPAFPFAAAALPPPPPPPQPPPPLPLALRQSLPRASRLSRSRLRRAHL